MKAAELVRKYLQEKQVVQLATLGGDQPWICNIHFVADDGNTIYWVSKELRRHSQEIHGHQKAAVGVAVKYPEHPVIGIQMEGDAQLVKDPAEIEKAMKLYDRRFNVSKKFYDGVISGEEQEKMYKFTPRVIVLFDEENFPGDPRQEWKVGE